MAATLGLVVAEVLGGILGRSVALLNDAVHNLSDVPALGISYLAMRWAERPADSEKTYGYHRAGTLAAFTNALSSSCLRFGLAMKPSSVSAPL
jgi:cobalt-zinc-cadmium efflux system protein